ncbi:DNA ligase-1 [Granulicella rosea]|uniref:DNA ligase n=1 Tax=Granulicella rosea TaxID=474952 RepID=A0A239LT66_9BACT|nr:ATP-dependent DNA ligase [Granulicella rosea]SNT33003.1 DNA ligase-1 [Granulicella rosea]
MTTFAQVAALAEEMAGTASRLKKRAAIVAALQAAHTEDPAGQDAALFAQYLAGLPFAEADPRKLNAGGSLLSKAVLAVSEATEAQLTAAYRRHGDLGAAAYDLREGWAGTVSTLPLGEIAEVFAAMATAKTTAIRAALVESLLRRATALEAKYLLKLMLGDMRIGVKQSLVEEAIALAAGVSVEAVRNAVMLEADLGLAATRAFTGTLDEARMTLFHPLGFMLASPVETPEEAIERFTPKPPAAAKKKTVPQRLKPHVEGEEDGTAEAVPLSNPEISTDSAQVHAFLEDKYDGMRAQIHCGDPAQPGRVAIYSRNREDITESFPELAEAFAHADAPLILDGEILGWDYASGTALPFAVLSQRIGRKRVGNDLRQQIPVVFMAFDLMFADGHLLLPLELKVRRNKLESVVERLVDRVQSPLVLSEHAARRHEPQAALFADEEPAEPGVPRLMIAPSKLVESADEIDRAYADARARSNEGVMLKAAASPYLPGRRGIWWVKLKRELATLDVVITGAEYGHGRRAGLLSDYTFAVRNEAGELENVGKAYSGVTDAEILELTDFLKAHTLEDRGHFRTVEPLIVLEVAFNNIMRSTRHASGFALRFPRILHIRRDKPLAEIDTVARVEEIYQSQVDKPVEA